MYSIGRVLWGSDRARKMREALEPNSEAVKQLNRFLKDGEVSVFSYTIEGVDSGYFAVTGTPDDATLVCHHMQEIKKGAFSPIAFHLLMDHTGTKDIMLLCESDAMYTRLSRYGFVEVEHNWSADTRLYRNITVDARIEEVTGLDSHDVTPNDLQQMLRIIGFTMLDEAQGDPFGRSIFSSLLPEEVIERARMGHYRTFIWREDGIVKGVAQLEYNTWGGVSLTGLGVDANYRKARIGRNLVAKVLQIAGETHEALLATSFVNNGAATHLFGNVLRWSSLAMTMGIQFQPEAVSWKRTKNKLGLASNHIGPTLEEV